MTIKHKYKKNDKQHGRIDFFSKLKKNNKVYFQNRSEHL